MIGPYVHSIDPIIGSIGGVYLWWYGLSYALGFLNAHLFIRRKRAALGLALPTVYDLSLMLAVGVLLGGRVVETIFYEWPFYRAHPGLIPAYWLGGMATHGLMAGGLVGVWLFCRRHRKPFFEITDVLAIPAAFILGIGRLGNFIDGQIVGGVTSVWWAVQFPDASGFRHPVVLYDGLKNFLLLPLLVTLRQYGVPRGVLTGVFLFLYAFLRIFIDLFREYPTTLAGLATGQALNLLMAVLGLVLVLSRMRGSDSDGRGVPPHEAAATGHAVGDGLWWRRLLFGSLLAFSLTLPSDWTQDVPARYGSRHPGLRHSAIYPVIDTTPESNDARGTPHADNAP
ncbi:MAG: prolipoprotein diacylglyceryl transferase [Lentisphaerae bacterium]|nr:prolipoprotein diacylglyceryl transferase [Lentisphaerota bacterium]